MFDCPTTGIKGDMDGFKEEMQCVDNSEAFTNALVILAQECNAYLRSAYGVALLRSSGENVR